MFAGLTYFSLYLDILSLFANMPKKQQLPSLQTAPLQEFPNKLLGNK